MFLSKNRVLVFFLLLVCFANAQDSIVLSNKVKQKVLHQATGMLLLKTSKGVIGISPKEKKIVWNNPELKKVDFTKMVMVPLSPFIIFDKKPLVNSEIASKTLKIKGATRLIVNAETGKVLFNSALYGFDAVLNTKIIGKKKALLVDGLKDGKPVIGLYGYKDHKIYWETSLDDYNFYKEVKGSLLDNARFFVDNYGTIFWLRSKVMYEINGQTGAIVFKENGIEELRLSTDKKQCFVFKKDLKIKKLNEETTIYSYGSKNKPKSWKDSVRITGKIREIAQEKEELVIRTAKGFYIIDVKTGHLKWKKGAALPLIKKIVKVANGYLVVQENHIEHIDNSGKKTWKKPVKITHSQREKPLHFISDKNEVLYISPSFANKLKLRDGNKVWDTDLVLNEASYISRTLNLNEQIYEIWLDKKRGNIPVYSNGLFYIFNLNQNKAPKEIRGYNFGKEMPHLEIRPKSYLLYNAHNFYSYSHSGKLLFKRQYPNMGKKSFLKQSVYWVDRGIKTYKGSIHIIVDQMDFAVKEVFVGQNLGVVGTGISTVYGTLRSYQESVDDITDMNRIQVQSYLENVFARFNQAKKKNNFHYIVSPTKEKNKLQLVQLHKDSGVEKKLITFENDKSNFIIDPIEELIYNFGDKKVFIHNYNFSK